MNEHQRRFDWLVPVILIIGIMIFCQWFVLSYPHLFPIEQWMINQYCVGIFILICVVMLKPVTVYLHSKVLSVVNYFKARAIVKDVEQFEKMRAVLKWVSVTDLINKIHKNLKEVRKYKEPVQVL